MIQHCSIAFPPGAVGRRCRSWGVAVALGAMVLAGCSGDDDASPTSIEGQVGVSEPTSVSTSAASVVTEPASSAPTSTPTSATAPTPSSSSVPASTGSTSPESSTPTAPVTSDEAAVRAVIDLWFSSWTDCLATLPMPCDPAPIQASRSGTAFEGAAEQIETWINLQVTVTGLNTRHLDAVESVAVSGQMATATACVSEQATVTTGEGRVIGSGYEATRHQLELEMVDGTWKVVTNDIVATSVVEGEALCVGS